MGVNVGYAEGQDALERLILSGIGDVADVPGLVAFGASGSNVWEIACDRIHFGDPGGVVELNVTRKAQVLHGRALQIFPDIEEARPARAL